MEIELITVGRKREDEKIETRNTRCEYPQDTCRDVKGKKIRLFGFRCLIFFQGNGAFYEKI